MCIRSSHKTSSKFFEGYFDARSTAHLWQKHAAQGSTFVFLGLGSFWALGWDGLRAETVCFPFSWVVEMHEDTRLSYSMHERLQRTAAAREYGPSAGSRFCG